MKGHEVVYHAAISEPDEIWFYNALDLGAAVFISSDLDIANMVGKEEKLNIHWIDLQNRGYENGETNKYLLEKIKVLEAK